MGVVRVCLELHDTLHDVVIVPLNRREVVLQGAPEAVSEQLQGVNSYSCHHIGPPKPDDRYR